MVMLFLLWIAYIVKCVLCRLSVKQFTFISPTALWSWVLLTSRVTVGGPRLRDWQCYSVMEGFPSTCKAHLEFCHLAPREAQVSNHRTIMVARSSILNSRLCCQFHTTRPILYYFTNSYEFDSLVSNLYQPKTNLLLLSTFPFSSPLSITCESCLIVLRQ